MDSVDFNPAQENELRLDEKSRLGDYGPKGTGQKVEAVEAREPVISLVLYDSMYHSQLLIPYLKKLEASGVKINVISSYGLGGVIAALYAKKQSVSYVEWKLFSLNKVLKQYVMFSTDWMREMNSFISKEFGDTKLNQLKTLMVVPFLRDKNLVLNYQGAIAKSLTKSLLLAKKHSFTQQPINYSNKIKALFSSDLSIQLAFLPKTPRITSLGSYEYGVQTSYLGRIMKMPEEFGLVMGNSQIPLDSLVSMNEYVQDYSQEIDNISTKFLERSKQWKESNSKTLKD